MGLGSHEHLSEAEDPAEVRQRIASTVRDLRQRAGRSLADLASAAGIGKSTLHAIEAGDANPGIETLWALARALGVPFGALIEPPAPRVRVVRAGEGPWVDSEASAIRARLVTTIESGGRVEVYDLTLEPGGDRIADAHTVNTLEHVLVTTGRLRTGPKEAPVELGAGDLATFPGDVPHVYEALEPGTRIVLLMAYG